MNNLSGINQVAVYWTRIPSRPQTNYRSFLVPETEEKLCEILAKIGVVSSGQIQAHQVLHTSPKKSRLILKKMKQARKVVEHKLVIGKKEYKLYTLGPNGTDTANYEPDYWFSYSEDDVLQRIMAFELYMKMSDYLSAEIKIRPAESPYTLEFLVNDKLYQIGIVWDNAVPFVELYRWSKPTERTVLVCQEISQVDCLVEYLDENLPIRAIPKEKIRNELAFFRIENGKWALDIPGKEKIKRKTSKEEKPKVVIQSRKKVLL